MDTTYLMLDRNWREEGRIRVRYSLQKHSSGVFLPDKFYVLKFLPLPKLQLPARDQVFSV